MRMHLETNMETTIQDLMETTMIELISTATSYRHCVLHLNLERSTECTDAAVQALKWSVTEQWRLWPKHSWPQRRREPETRENMDAEEG